MTHLQALLKRAQASVHFYVFKKILLDALGELSIQSTRLISTSGDLPNAGPVRHHVRPSAGGRHGVGLLRTKI